VPEFSFINSKKNSSVKMFILRIPIERI